MFLLAECGGEISKHGEEHHARPSQQDDGTSYDGPSS